jgi:hypothetical protein
MCYVTKTTISLRRFTNIALSTTRILNNANANNTTNNTTNPFAIFTNTSTASSYAATSTIHPA